MSISGTSNAETYFNPSSSRFCDRYWTHDETNYQPDLQISTTGQGIILLLKATSSGGYACALTPALNIPLNSISVSFRAKTPNLGCRLEVGVMDVPGGVFTPVDTITPFATNTLEEYEVLISGVGGNNNNYVAFRVSYNIIGAVNTYYIDDVII